MSAVCRSPLTNALNAGLRAVISYTQHPEKIFTLGGEYLTLLAN